MEVVANVTAEAIRTIIAPVGTEKPVMNIVFARWRKVLIRLDDFVKCHSSFYYGKVDDGGCS